MEQIRGTVHGKVIELEQELGFPDGQQVTLLVQPVLTRADEEQALKPGEGLRRAFGAWAEDADELDNYLEWNRQQQSINRPEIDP